MGFRGTGWDVSSAPPVRLFRGRMGGVKHLLDGVLRWITTGGGLQSVIREGLGGGGSIPGEMKGAGAIGHPDEGVGRWAGCLWSVHGSADGSCHRGDGWILSLNRWPFVIFV